MTPTAARAADRVKFDARQYALGTHRGRDLSLERHPESPDPEDLAAVRGWARAAVGPTAIDLFSGAGGLSLGLQDAGFSVLVGADSDAVAVETHTANVGGLGYLGDLSDPEPFLAQLRSWGIRSVDLVAGGPPCQPFSRAGRSKIRNLIATGQRSSADPRSHMWRSFVHVVEVLKPKAVLLENVPDLAAWDDGAVLTGFCETLRGLGYRPEARILNAYEHGVPQHRSRLFVIALRPGRIMEWPAASKHSPTVNDAIGDLPVVPPAHRKDRIPYGKARSALQRRLRRDMDPEDARSIYDHITRDVRADDAEAYALMHPGQTYEDLPERLRRYRDDIFSDKYKRLEWDGLSRSITAHIAKDGYWYIHPEQDRTLSVREAARIQTFPDWFRFAGQPSLRYRQIGNAVPPLLAEAIGHRLHRALSEPPRRGRPPGTGRSFRDELLSWHADHQRSFPWRETSNPWHVLVAEMCLRRTRADQVAAIYRELIRIAPTPAAMTRNREAVMRATRSLGLRWRVDNLLAVARVLVKKFNGEVPSNEADLLSLPGVGDYVTAAVLTFGFGRNAVLLDTNTQRIVGRVRKRVLRRWQLRLDLHQLAGQPGPDAAFNYALLDLGALACRARDPLCVTCPVRRRCESYRQGDIIAAAAAR
jgi:DNA (cytosine-5)-methyltransferase 1